MTTSSALALAAAVFVILGIGLVFCVRSLIKGNREDVIADVPIASEQRLRRAHYGS